MNWRSSVPGHWEGVLSIGIMGITAFLVCSPGGGELVEDQSEAMKIRGMQVERDFNDPENSLFPCQKYTMRPGRQAAIL